MNAEQEIIVAHNPAERRKWLLRGCDSAIAP